MKNAAAAAATAETLLSTGGASFGALAAVWCVLKGFLVRAHADVDDPGKKRKPSVKTTVALHLLTLPLRASLSRLVLGAFVHARDGCIYIIVSVQSQTSRACIALQLWQVCCVFDGGVQWPWRRRL